MFDLNKGNIKKVLWIIAFTLFLYAGLNHVPEVLRTIGILISLLSPFLLGSCIAFILNVPMRFIERKLLGRSRLKPSLKRMISLVLALIFIVVIILIVFFLVIPELANTIQGLFVSVPRAFQRFQSWLLSFEIPWPQIQEEIANWNMDWGKFINQLIEFLKTGFIGSIFTTVGVVSSIVSGFVNFFIGFVFAIYILCQKEKLARQGKKICYAIFPMNVADQVIYVVTLTEKTFSNFLTGQCMEAIILGTMFFVAMSLLRFPFALLVGVLISVTALIPIVGAFIGCAIGMFLILTVNPIQVIWFFILFNVLPSPRPQTPYPGLQFPVSQSNPSRGDRRQDRKSVV